MDETTSNLIAQKILNEHSDSMSDLRLACLKVSRAMAICSGEYQHRIMLDKIIQEISENDLKSK